ncbi:MAG: protein translocase subunit SecF [Pseudomonadota bacterium]|nr:protein translocase subunit SecF [Pseudomonadota bacterium]
MARSIPGFRFMAYRRVAMVVSALLLVGSMASLAVRGLNFGIDFTGGTLVEVRYSVPGDVGDVRNALLDGGFADATAQHFGDASDVLVRLPASDTGDLGVRVLQALRAAAAEGETVDLRREEFVGPQVGDELAEDGALAMIWALGGILVYIAFRFRWQFALGAIAALVHDTIITVGFFSVTRLPFDLTVLAALLAVIGYSLNDTIVIFDRIRETFLRRRKGTVMELIDRSLNETLSRTLVTGVTTLLVLVALLVVGGEVIRGFAIALILGVVIGTYSSLYIASPVLSMLGLTREDMLEGEKEQAVP